MSDKDLIMTLAKVIIAAAWVDDQITLEEVNSLKDLLFRLPYVASGQEMQLTARDWARLEIYIETPVDAAERARLVDELRAGLRNPQDRALALAALDELIQADGLVTDEERLVAEEIRRALEVVDLSIFGKLGRLIRGPVQRRTEAVANAPNREQFFEDYVKNKIYYKVRQRLNWDGTDLGIAEADLRKLSLGGGLMARVAYVDQDVTDEEFTVMVEALKTGGDLSPAAAVLVAEVAVSEICDDLDYFRLVREFFTSTDEDERISFLDMLFAVAAADGDISAQESVEIRHIARSIGLSQQKFVEAKAKIA